MAIRLGRGTLRLENRPSIEGYAAIGGKMEREGPLGNEFDLTNEDTTFGETTWEKAESRMQKTALERAMAKAKVSPQEVDMVFAGDLLNQCVSSTYGLRDLGIPFLGLYGACSTMAESLAMASLFLEGGLADRAAAVTSSHFCSAERQYRYPLELGCTRPPQSQWTVTGAGACVISADCGRIKLLNATLGRVRDWGVTDVNNMGAAMAPAASKVILAHLHDTGRRPEYYDLILTGDLGVLGSRILKDLLWESGTDVFANHDDCGAMIYARAEDEFQGGSGAGCSAVVFGSYILRELAAGRLNKVLFVATGALLSPVSSGQGESIPCIAHAVAVENDLS